MSQQSTIEKLAGKSLDETIIYNDYRLKGLDILIAAIEQALEAMKAINKNYLKSYERTETWSKVNAGLMKHSLQASLESIVEFKVCESQKAQKSYFNPFSKKPITMCYNKFLKEDDFNQALNYNIILYYDSKTRRNLNWNKLQDAVLTNVRAIHLSGICKQNDRQCLRRELQSRVFEKQRFRGKTMERLSEIIQEGLQDSTPISQVVLRTD